MNDYEIDFVIPWVDGADPIWQANFKLYTKDQKNADATIQRYRDNGLLHFWFRGVERYSPWVRKIHFVTQGHIPKWLNTLHPKINIVKHCDYIDEIYLPTFNSHVIELNLHKIKGLSERFVYFNDDTFIINSIKSDYYFSNKLPNDCAILNALTPGGVAHVILNDLEVINKYFRKNDVLRNAFLKWINIKYGTDLFRTICLLPWPKFIGIKDTHLPLAYLKKTFEEVWEKENKLLSITNESKFRKKSDVNQYLFRYWQLAKGDFNSQNTIAEASYMDISLHTITEIEKQMNNNKNKLIVINDGQVENYEYLMSKVNDIFSKRFPDKSTFEL